MISNIGYQHWFWWRQMGRSTPWWRVSRSLPFRTRPCSRCVWCLPVWWFWRRRSRGSRSCRVGSLRFCRCRLRSGRIIRRGGRGTGRVVCLRCCCSGRSPCGSRRAGLWGCRCSRWRRLGFRRWRWLRPLRFSCSWTCGGRCQPFSWSTGPNWVGSSGWYLFILVWSTQEATPILFYSLISLWRITNILNSFLFETIRRGSWIWWRCPCFPRVCWRLSSGDILNGRVIRLGQRWHSFFFWVSGGLQGSIGSWGGRLWGFTWSVRSISSSQTFRVPFSRPWDRSLRFVRCNRSGFLVIVQLLQVRRRAIRWVRFWGLRHLRWLRAAWFNKVN